MAGFWERIIANFITNTSVFKTIQESNTNWFTDWYTRISHDYSTSGIGGDVDSDINATSFLSTNAMRVLILVKLQLDSPSVTSRNWLQATISDVSADAGILQLDNMYYFGLGSARPLRQHGIFSLTLDRSIPNELHYYNNLFWDFGASAPIATLRHHVVAEIY